MRYLSVCSGIEAASVAWHPLGWRCVGMAEIDPFASAVLAHRYPDTPNFGNLEHYRDWPLKQGDIDLLVGGTPCQAFSVAGLRRGLDDPRGNLALTYLGLVEHLRPRWVVWENVPGVLSSSGGRDFGAFLGGVAQLGYGFAYRVLDAQYVRVDSHPGAVPQRRRRVFVVGCAGGDWQRAARVLLEPEGVRGDPPTRRQTRQATTDSLAGGVDDGRQRGVAVAHSLTASTGATEDGTGRETPLCVVPIDLRQTARGENNTNNRHNSSGGSPGTGTGNDGDPAFTVSARGQAVAIAFSCKDYGGDATIGVAPTLRAMPHDGSHANGGGQVAVAFHATTGGNDGGVYQDGSTPTITTGRRPAIAFHSSLGSRNGDVFEDVCTVVRSSGPPAIALAFQPRIARNGRGQLEPVCPAGDACQNLVPAPAIAWGISSDAIDRSGEGDGSAAQRAGLGITEECSPSLRARHAQAVAFSIRGDAMRDGGQAVMQSGVRRLTPRECERLQGFPDDWTLVEYRGKPVKDGPRYKAIGNSMAVNVMRWLGERIAFVESDAARSPVEAAKKELARGAQLAFPWA